MMHHSAYLNSDSHQSLNLFERLGGIIEMGQRLVKPITH